MNATNEKIKLRKCVPITRDISIIIREFPEERTRKEYETEKKNKVKSLPVHDTASPAI